MDAQGNSASHSAQLLQPAIRFTKEECLDLPDMVYVKRKVEMTKQQIKYYEELRKKMVMQVEDESITAVNAAIVLNKLLQISSGAVYTDDSETLEFDISNRYKVLKEAIDESSQKVLVFVPFRHTIDLLANKLTTDGITCGIIRGDVSANKRTEIFDSFQTTPNPQVLIIQPQAAAPWGHVNSSEYRCVVGSNIVTRDIRTGECTCPSLWAEAQMYCHSALRFSR